MNRRDFLKRASAAAVAAYTFNASLAAKQSNPSGQGILMRKIPSTGEQIPAVGLGTWNAFMPRDLTKKDVMEPLTDVLSSFYGTGGRLIDTAPAYGTAEEVTGMLSEKLEINKALFIATKISATGKDAATKMIDESFRRLRRDKIELIQVHNLIDWQNNLAILRERKKAGQFKYIGVTHLMPGKMDDLAKIAEKEKIDAIQLPYSVGMRDAEKRLIPACKDNGVAILVMRPFEGGNLFKNAINKDVPDSIKPWATSWGAAFLKWILANEAITVVLPATSKLDHLKDNMRAGFGRLPDEKERQELIKALE